LWKNYLYNFKCGIFPQIKNKGKVVDLRRTKYLIKIIPLILVFGIDALFAGLCSIGIIPPLVISSPWIIGLIPALALILLLVLTTTPKV